MTYERHDSETCECQPERVHNEYAHAATCPVAEWQQSDERRERYAAAIQQRATGGIKLNSILPEVYDAADAAMAVADAEQTELRHSLHSAGRAWEDYTRENARLRAELATLRPDPEHHAYLSTSCLHGEHGYCQAHTGLSGAKTPAVCKFCKAPCQCQCHAKEQQ